MITINRQPVRIHALSLGYEEIMLAFVSPERFSAVSSFAVNPSFSNVVDVAGRVGRTIGRDAEAILSTNPDVVIASGTTRSDLVDRLRATGTSVMIAPWRESVDALPKTIRWLASITGDEVGAGRLISEIEQRFSRIDRIVSTKPTAARPTVVILESMDYVVAGRGTFIDVILTRAGGLNAAAIAGIEGDKAVGLESLLAINPDVLIVEEDPTNPNVLDRVRAHPALRELAAVKGDRIYPVSKRYLSTLSHWQVRGIEEIARALWRTDFANERFEDFK